MINIALWSNRYNIGYSVSKVTSEIVNKFGYINFIALCEKIINSPIAQHEVCQATAELFTNICDKKKQKNKRLYLAYPLNYTGFYERVGKLIYNDITTPSYLITYKDISLLNLIHKSAALPTKYFFPKNNIYFVLCFALFYLYLPECLDRTEKKFYRTSSLEDFYEYIIGDNALRGVKSNVDIN